MPVVFIGCVQNTAASYVAVVELSPRSLGLSRSLNKPAVFLRCGHER